MLDHGESGEKEGGGVAVDAVEVEGEGVESGSEVAARFVPGKECLPLWPRSRGKGAMSWEM